MKKIKLTYLFILISFTLISQKEKDSIVNYYNKFRIIPQFGLYYQRNAFVNFGVSFHRYEVYYVKAGNCSPLGMNHFGMSISSDFIVRFDKTIVSPKISFDMCGIGATSGSAFGIDINYYKNQSNNFIGITPRLVLPLDYFGFYYGYTFYITQNEFDPFIGHHRIGINWIINQKYIKKGKEMFLDYFEYQSKF